MSFTVFTSEFLEKRLVTKMHGNLLETKQNITKNPTEINIQNVCCWWLPDCVTQSTQLLLFFPFVCVTKMIKVLEHLPYEKEWVTWVCSALRKEDSALVLFMFINILRVGAEVM